MPTLYLMRHGQADNASPDIKRKLTVAGREQVKSMANTFANNNIKINHVVYSSASRTKETALLMCAGLNIAVDYQQENKQIYNASVSTLQAVISAIDQKNESVLLVGHNPGLADLVLTLSEQFVRLSAGNIAVMQADSWQDVIDCKCKLIGKF